LKSRNGQFVNLEKVTGSDGENCGAIMTGILTVFMCLLVSAAIYLCWRGI